MPVISESMRPCFKVGLSLCENAADLKPFVEYIVYPFDFRIYTAHLVDSVAYGDSGRHR